ncbi:hypothetical protein GDO86_007622 [Hymenochirus boettgeri]|uniref:Protein crumbs homolog 1 n=1 Tax=Hymenochirus boettgeri TaxID=247094 RepID=A0A8T2IXA3_9PIPI|nr:hypothetical protein GDO86_007622 [Hymenochirus boettgeri]
MMVGFTGMHCEKPLCWSQPCHNNATCKEDSGTFTCICLPEIKISECSSQPCQYDSECVELPWEETTNDITVTGTYKHHDGYICKCGRGLTGVHCESDINECESNPCQNGGICENLHGSYTCHCKSDQSAAERIYGGKNCDELLVGCENHKCQNGGACIPQLNEGKHSHHCLCPSGFTGPNCMLQTTFSFNGKAVLPVKNVFQYGRDYFFNISLSFQTVQTYTAVIFLMINYKTSIKLYLQNGYIFLSSEVDGKRNALLHLSHNISDDQWHAIEVTLTDILTLRLLDVHCTTRCMNSSVHNIGIDPGESVFHEVLLGGELSGHPVAESKHTSTIQEQNWFVGCLRDIRLGSTLLTEESVTQSDVVVGCKRQDQCESQPCRNRGRCINLWQSYNCDCFRPYRGINCSLEYDPGRFGLGQLTSYVVFKGDFQWSKEIIISAFFRTRQPIGVLLALGNATSYDIIISLDGGRLIIRTVRGLILKGTQPINDGNFHLVSLKLTQNKMEIFTLKQLVGQVEMNKAFVTNVLYVGGLDDTEETTKHGGYFKGCVQDLRIAEQHLEFFHQTKTLSSLMDITVNNVTQGCENDNHCKSSPCRNGGVCYSIWDDYYCSCPSNTTGKACEDIMWCQLAQCPLGSICQIVPSGYECTTSVIFNGTGHGITYKSNGNISRDLTNVTLQFRTQASDSILLHAERDPEAITIAVQNSHLLFHLQSGNSINSVRLHATGLVNDNQWHSVALSMVTPQSQSSQWQMEIDGQKDKVISLFSTGNLNFLREGTEIFLGVQRNSGNLSFLGCMGIVQIGGIYLPYFRHEDYQIKKTQKEQFIKTSPGHVGIKCQSSASCSSQSCIHGANCPNVLTHPICTCPPGMTGTICETHINGCLYNPCLHGNCTVTLEGYSCECEAGYSGINCDVYSCQGHQCVNGATCIGQANGYYCLCPENATGPFCRVNRKSSTFCGNEKKNITCYNYSNCTEGGGNLRCTCFPGFVGERCEIDVDECDSDPCLNGGLCQNLPNRFHCICDMNFAGDRCEIDLSDFMPPGIFTVVASIVLGLFFIVCAGLCIFIAVSGMRSSHGTYSPSRQEKEGSRVEMWNIVQPPPLERLI